MTGPEARDRTKLVEPPDLERRIDEGWIRLSASKTPAASERPAQSVPWFRQPALTFGGGALAGAIVSIITLFMNAPPPPTVAVVTAEDAPIEVHMEDGSVIRASSETTIAQRVQTARRVELELKRGQAAFAVAQNPGRSFVVVAGDIEVWVVGTRFTMDRRPGTVSVSVEEGIVDVLVQGTERYRLVRGDERHFSRPHAASGKTGEPLKGDRALEEGGASELASASANPPALPRASGALPGRPLSETLDIPNRPKTAAELFEQADRARRVGEPTAAVSGFGRFIDRFPDHPKAPLAAMLRGRILMDALDQPRSAIRSFRAVLSAGPPLREDAMARIVRAWDRLGDTKACRSARLEYDASFPKGRYTATLAQLCVGTD